MRLFHVMLVAGSAVLSAATLAAARPVPDGGVTAAEVVDVMTTAGYKANVEKDSRGDPIIRSSASGAKFSVEFYGCDASKRCASLQFTAWFDHDNRTPARVAKWNATRRFGKASTDDDGDVQFTMDIVVAHGATTELLASNFERWDSVLGNFRNFMYGD